MSARASEKVVVRTTGESPTVSFDEHKELIRKAVQFAGGRIPVVAGTGANSTAEAVELAALAEAKVAANQHHPFMAEMIVHQRVQIAGVARHIAETVGRHVAVAEAAEVGNDHLEPCSRQWRDHLPEDALRLGPTVHADERYASHSFPDVRLLEATGCSTMHREPLRVDVLHAPKLVPSTTVSLSSLPP